MPQNRQVHVTDVNANGAFAVNTFDRALRGVNRPIADLPHVLHMRQGRPSVGVMTGKTTDANGHTRIEMIEPARGPRGPYVRNVSTDAEMVYPQSEPTAEGRRFMTALAQYRHNPNDYYWEQANEALAEWLKAAEESQRVRRHFDRAPIPREP